MKKAHIAILAAVALVVVVAIIVSSGLTDKSTPKTDADYKITYSYAGSGWISESAKSSGYYPDGCWKVTVTIHNPNTDKNVVFNSDDLKMTYLDKDWKTQTYNGASYVSYYSDTIEPGETETFYMYVSLFPSCYEVVGFQMESDSINYVKK